MYDWQKKVLQKLSSNSKKTEQYVMVAGRRWGKSAFRNMMNDLYPTPITNIHLDEARVHGTQYYTARPEGGEWLKMEAWCYQRFGLPSSIWSEDLGRWYANDRKFLFRKEQDRLLFLLKWN